jgi:hypothetical protein
MREIFSLKIMDEILAFGLAIYTKTTCFLHYESYGKVLMNIHLQPAAYEKQNNVEIFAIILKLVFKDPH